MTIEETKEVLKFLRGCYPAFYRNMSPSEADAIVLAWSTLFADEAFDYETTLNAVKLYVAGKLYDMPNALYRKEASGGSYKNFPPSPGVILNAVESEIENRKYTLALMERQRRRNLAQRNRKALDAGKEIK